MGKEMGKEKEYYLRYNVKYLVEISTSWILVSCIILSSLKS